LNCNKGLYDSDKVAKALLYLGSELKGGSTIESLSELSLVTSGLKREGDKEDKRDKEDTGDAGGDTGNAGGDKEDKEDTSEGLNGL
jgi:hypothetical protein